MWPSGGSWEPPATPWSPLEGLPGAIELQVRFRATLPCVGLFRAPLGEPKTAKAGVAVDVVVAVVVVVVVVVAATER